MALSAPAAVRRCMNAACAASDPGGEWVKGWAMRSGGFADLCHGCGMAYEHFIFCDTFHLKESGWRECKFCGKHLHCGCVASKSSIDLLDSGGVQCMSCRNNAEFSLIPSDQNKEVFPQSTNTVIAVSSASVKDAMANNLATALFHPEMQPSVEGSLHNDIISKDQSETIHTGKQIESSLKSSNPVQRECIDDSSNNVRQEQLFSLLGEAGCFMLPNRIQCFAGSSHIFQNDESKIDMADNALCDSLSQACLNISLGNSNVGNILDAVSTAQTLHPVHSSNSLELDGKDQNREVAIPQQMHRSQLFSHIPPKAGDGASPESSRNGLSPLRVARPPGEGRGRNQLLPRYWPRITDQELQQISGSSNSTIVPLFEKVLSASDAGRIGRLVLPKACAEAYFPPISQPEGRPLTIQDSKGKDWHFQFRFWPNNNSRMYVLEGVTPCIQSLQLQAGDTVTFSRIDPEGKLVMGFRKATNSLSYQDSQISAMANVALGTETFLSGGNENVSIISGYSVCQSLKGTTDTQLCTSEQFNLADGIITWHKPDKNVGMATGRIPLPPFLVPERKTFNIGLKSKRLQMGTEDAWNLKLTWEEAQDLLRPPPSSKPSIVVIEDHEFEEYEEPPIFGKRTIFTAQISGEQDQWIRCDDCLKWRRLPVDVIVPSKWICADNNWDLKGSSCSLPCELSVNELQDLLGQDAELKRRRIASSIRQNPSGSEASVVEGLAAGDVTHHLATLAPSAAVTTTRHPRHRPGCTCIVCIQPPSGKGPKHSAACTCNVCMTVKRRFKTLMMRKKQRQTEHEEAEAQKRLLPWGSSREEAEASSSLKNLHSLEGVCEPELAERVGTDNIDLNFRPRRGDTGQMSMMSLLKVACNPLKAYLQQHGLKSLDAELQVCSSSQGGITEAPAEDERRAAADDISIVAAADAEQDTKSAVAAP